MMERYHWRDKNVPDWRFDTGRRRLAIYDRRARQEPIAVCTDPDVAERLTRLLNVDEAQARTAAFLRELANEFAEEYRE